MTSSHRRIVQKNKAKQGAEELSSFSIFYNEVMMWRYGKWERSGGKTPKETLKNLKKEF